MEEEEVVAVVRKERVKRRKSEGCASQVTVMVISVVP